MAGDTQLRRIDRPDEVVPVMLTVIDNPILLRRNL
jgi:hypothetical protein